MEGPKTTVVLGASDDPERYANRAMRKLAEAGHPFIPVNPGLAEVLGVPAKASLGDISGEVDTVTVYLSAKRSTPLAADLAALKPRRVILNPGAENPELEAALDGAGIPWMHACTLVLLSTGRY